MKMTLHILTLLLFSSTTVVGQDISHSDSLEVTKACKDLFEMFDNKDSEGISESSTEKIYCTICSGSHVSSETSYFFDKNDFIENHFWTTEINTLIRRSRNYNELMIIKSPSEGLEIITFWTTYKPNELSIGHEGAQFGIRFKKVNGEFKFSGMETIP